MLLLIKIQAENVVVGNDVVLRDEEGFVVRCSSVFLIEVMEAINDVGDIIDLYFITLVVEREAVILHVVEPDFVGAAVICLVEDDYGSLNTGVRLEDSAGHVDDGSQLLMLNQFLSDNLVSFSA